MLVDAPQEIDRNAYEPAYVQLINILEGQIAAGQYRPGDQLPSEAQLCQRYQVSPMTVRRVINILVEHGLVTTAQGRGTFVKGPDLGEATFRLRELKRYISQSDRVRAQLLEARIVPADERIGRKLGIKLGQWAVYIRRLLIEEDTPIIYHREYLVYDPAKPVIEGELEATSLVGLFQNTGQTVLKGGHLTIEAVTLHEEEARLLQAPLGSAALCLEHIFHDFEDRPASWGWFIWRGDRIKFTAVVGVRAAK